MAYNVHLADRIRNVVSEREGISERKMFGGIAFMLHGNMCCGVIGDDLMVRVGSAGYDEALSHPHTRQMDFTGKPSKGMIYVGPEGSSSQQDLEAWVLRGIDYAASLPKK